MTVRIYRSSDASAPTLTGQVGSLVALLDACLVNGYGALAAAGWTKPLSTTNKGAYLQNLTGSNNSSGMLLYVDDTAPGAAGAREARVCGFETMSAITPVGTGQFPTSAQSTIGVGCLVIRKSTTADATARNWTMIANGQSFYLFVESGDATAPLGTVSFFFGDIKSYKSGDQYALMIMGKQTENSVTNTNEPMQGVGGASMSLNNKMFGHYMPRSWTGVGGSMQVAKTVDCGKIFASPNQWSVDTSLLFNAISNFTFGRNSSSNILQTPNGPDGSLWLSPVYVFHSYAFRGYLPGLWCPLQDRPFTHNDTFTVASGNLSGKSMVCQQIFCSVANGNDAGYPLIEYSDTWT